MQKKVIAFILVIGLLASIFVVPASAASKTLYIPAVKQDKSLWCWAAVAQQGILYKAGKSVSQSTIVQYVKGNTNNQEGTMADIQKALAHWGVSSRIYYSTETYWDIKNDIDNYRPIIGYIDWTSGSGHFVMIKGWNDSSTYYGAGVTWTSSNTTTGYTFTDFINDFMNNYYYKDWYKSGKWNYRIELL